MNSPKNSMIKQLISYVTFIRRMGTQAKFIPCDRKSANMKWQQTVNLLFNLSTTYFMEDMERASFKNSIIKFHLMFWKVFPPILRWPLGVNIPSCFSLLKCDLKRSKFYTITPNCKFFVCFFIQQMQKNKTQYFKTKLKYFQTYIFYGF